MDVKWQFGLGQNIWMRNTDVTFDLTCVSTSFDRQGVEECNIHLASVGGRDGKNG